MQEPKPKHNPADAPWWKERQWYLAALKSVLAFAPFCALPALGLVIANSLIILALFFMANIFKGSQLELNQITQAAAAGLACSLSGTVLTGICLWVWLLRLTAFCHGRQQLINIAGATSNSIRTIGMPTAVRTKATAQSETKAFWQLSAAAIKKKQKHLFQV